MLRYRIEADETGRRFVLPALASIIPVDQTYATRRAAEDTAEWLNRLNAWGSLPAETTAADPRAGRPVAAAGLRSQPKTAAA